MSQGDFWCNSELPRGFANVRFRAGANYASSADMWAQSGRSVNKYASASPLVSLSAGPRGHDDQISISSARVSASSMSTPR